MDNFNDLCWTAISLFFFFLLQWIFCWSCLFNFSLVIVSFRFRIIVCSLLLLLSLTFWISRYFYVLFLWFYVVISFGCIIECLQVLHHVLFQLYIRFPFIISVVHGSSDWLCRKNLAQGLVALRYMVIISTCDCAWGMVPKELKSNRGVAGV